ncbi:MAG: hypothetical protein OEM52_12400, partial [bacterium]|nr:hypothetical protein [bacterium]
MKQFPFHRLSGQTHQIVALLVTFILIVTLSNAEPIPVEKFDPEKNVSVTITSTPAELPESGSATVRVVISLPEGYHITSRENEFFNVTTRDTLGLKFGQWQYPPTVKYKEQDVYQGKVVVKATMT